MVKKPELHKDADSFHIQIKDGELSFVDGSKEEKIWTLFHKVEVQDYVEALNVIKKSDEYIEHINVKMRI